MSAKYVTRGEFYRSLGQLYFNLAHLAEATEAQMADLTTALSDLDSEISSFEAEVSALQQQVASGDTAGIQAAADQLEQRVQAMKAWQDANGGATGTGTGTTTDPGTGTGTDTGTGTGTGDGNVPTA